MIPEQAAIERERRILSRIKRVDCELIAAHGQRKVDAERRSAVARDKKRVEAKWKQAVVKGKKRAESKLKRAIDKVKQRAGADQKLLTCGHPHKKGCYCEHCGKKIEKPYRGHQRFCGSKCQDKSWYHRKRKKPISIKRCPVCGTWFPQSKSDHACCTLKCTRHRYYMRRKAQHDDVAA